MPHNISIALSFLSIGLLTIAICLPLVQGRVKRNHLYGIRTPRAFESDELWFKINRYGGQQMISWGIVMLIFGVATLLLPQVTDQNQLALWFGGITLGTLLPAIVRIFLYSKRL